MVPATARIRSDIVAVRRAVQEALVQRAVSSITTPTNAMLVHAPGCDAYSEQLIEDAELQPVDKVVWMVLSITAARDGGATTLPTLEQLAMRANVSCRHTVERALSILRCTRWLSVCGARSDEVDTRRGCAYILHSRPVCIEDNAYLDCEYIAFLRKATRHYRAPVRSVARQVLTEIEHQGHPIG